MSMPTPSPPPLLLLASLPTRAALEMAIVPPELPICAKIPPPSSAVLPDTVRLDATAATGLLPTPVTSKDRPPPSPEPHSPSPVLLFSSVALVRLNGPARVPTTPTPPPPLAQKLCAVFA